MVKTNKKKNPPASAGDIRDTGFYPWVEKRPWRRAWHPLQYLAWRIPWTEELGGLQSIGLLSQKQ